MPPHLPPSHTRTQVPPRHQPSTPPLCTLHPHHPAPPLRATSPHHTIPTAPLKSVLLPIPHPATPHRPPHPSSLLTHASRHPVEAAHFLWQPPLAPLFHPPIAPHKPREQRDKSPHLAAAAAQAALAPPYHSSPSHPPRKPPPQFLAARFLARLRIPLPKLRLPKVFFSQVLV